jgi:hypothetical protein
MSDTPKHTGWKRFGWGDHRYVSSNGKIIASVRKPWRTWVAKSDLLTLGDYDSVEHAKAAIEKSMPFQMAVRNAE